MKPNEHQGPRIVVIGGGVAGLMLVTRLGHALGRRGLARITPIDRSWVHVWKPFFSNKRLGYLQRNGLDAEELCAKKAGLIHARVVHDDKGPWKIRTGFDEIGGAASGLFCIEGTPTHRKSPPIIPICDNVVGWFGTVGILAALRQRAVEGGRYRVNVSLTRVVALFARHFRQGAARSPRSVHGGDAVGHVSRADRPGGHVEDARLLQHGACAARLEQMWLAR
jgi:hypothetical protein